MKLLFFIILSFSGLHLFASSSENLCFRLSDAKTKEPLQGVSVFCLEQKVGASTNEKGEVCLQLRLPARVEVRYLGFQSQSKQFEKKPKNSPVEIALQEEGRQLGEAVVKASSTKRQMASAGLIQLKPAEFSKLPSLAGEKDPLQLLQLLPGIKKAANGSDGFFVRGGSADQNLVLIDGAPVYNPNHMLGFFSTFQAEAISELSLYKGAFPADKGGRLASVMDIKLQDGNTPSWKGTISAGTLAARAFVQGPLIPKKLGLSASFRRSYVEQLFALAGNKLPYAFHDGHLKLNWTPDNRNSLSYTLFAGNDLLRIDESSAQNASASIDFGTFCSNRIQALNYRHTGSSWFYHASLSQTEYGYRINAAIDNSRFGLSAELKDIQIKNELGYSFSPTTSFKTGLMATWHEFNPNQTSIYGDFNELLKKESGKRLFSQEAAWFVQGEHQFSPRWNLQLGLRLSGSAGNGFSYVNPEPRLNLTYKQLNQSLSFSYNKMTQYLHLVSGSSGLMPTDLWFPVSERVKPQDAHQFALSYSRTWDKSGWSLLLEPYFKSMSNLVEYREGTQLLLNNAIENDLVQGKGKAWGIEFLLRNDNEKWSTWISYTLSWSQRQFDAINQGRTFYGRYDRRQELAITGQYKLNERFAMNAVFSLSSGMRVTPVVGKYLMPSGSYNDVISIPIYGNRNSMVLAPLHRLDLSLNYTGKASRYGRLDWSIGAVNVYNRIQPFKLSSVKSPAGKVEYKQVGLYGFVPSVSFQWIF
ncbi:TonB-dependent receptor [Bacteroidota bacterium]